MNTNKALWEKGDFTKIADFMRQSGEDVVRSLGVAAPLRDIPALLRARGCPLR